MTTRSGSIVEGLPGFLEDDLEFFTHSKGGKDSPDGNSPVPPVDLIGSLSLGLHEKKDPLTSAVTSPISASTWNSSSGAVPVVLPFDLSQQTPDRSPPPIMTPPFIANVAGGDEPPSTLTSSAAQKDSKFPLHAQGYPPPPIFGNFSVPPMLPPQVQGGLWSQPGPPLHPIVRHHPPFIENATNHIMFQPLNMQYTMNQPMIPQVPPQGHQMLAPLRGSNRRMANVHRKNGHRRKGDDAAKYANAKLEDFVGDIYSLCKDQHGCRFLQRQLELKTEGDQLVVASMIFNEIYLKIVELMTDPFGNYLIQKLFNLVTTDQRLILVKNASPEFVRIALDPHGTRALQKLVESIDCSENSEEVTLLVELLAPNVVSLLRDLNGNHVVQKCLQRLSPSQNQFIFDAALTHCVEIATHRHGCCVLQRCLDHGSEAQRAQMSHEVAKNATQLSLDPFGNYVVQYVFCQGDQDLVDIILAHVKRNIITLSLHKFGSNVIEKLLRISKYSETLVEELLQHEERFDELLNDAYGNYVLQTSLDVALTKSVERLLAALLPLLPQIKNTPHGRRIMTKIQAIM